MANRFSFLVDVGEPAVVHLFGDLDVGTAPVLEELLAGVEGDLEIDCSRLLFVDSFGIGVFVRAARARAELGKRVGVRGLSTMARRVIEAAHFDDVLQLGDGPSPVQQAS